MADLAHHDLNIDLITGLNGSEDLLLVPWWLQVIDSNESGTLNGVCLWQRYRQGRIQCLCFARVTRHESLEPDKVLAGAYWFTHTVNEPDVPAGFRTSLACATHRRSSAWTSSDGAPGLARAWLPLENGLTVLYGLNGDGKTTLTCPTVWLPVAAWSDAGTDLFSWARS